MLETDGRTLLSTLSPSFAVDKYQGRRSNGSGVRALTDGRTDRQTDRHFQTCTLSPCFAKLHGRSTRARFCSFDSNSTESSLIQSQSYSNPVLILILIQRAAPIEDPIEYAHSILHVSDHLPQYYTQSYLGSSNPYIL